MKKQNWERKKTIILRYDQTTMLDRMRLISWACCGKFHLIKDPKALFSKANCIVVGNEHKEVLGFLIYTALGDVCRLEEIGVMPTEQRTGVGSFMLNALIAETESSRYSTFTVKITDQFYAAISFFMKHKFIVVGSVMDFSKGHVIYSLQRTRT